jgi:hypothetical protein
MSTPVNSVTQVQAQVQSSAQPSAARAQQAALKPLPSTDQPLIAPDTVRISTAARDLQQRAAAPSQTAQPAPSVDEQA